MRVIIKQHPGTGLWVSNDGRVILPPDRNNINTRLCKFRFTFGHRDKQGYLKVAFRGKQYYVHRLVAQVFLGDPPFSGATVDHYPNRDKTANFVENLRWADRKMQSDNRQFCEDSLEKYGVRECEDKKAYMRVYNREYLEKQRLLGRRDRRCPDGKRRLLTDAEFNARFGNESRQLPLF